MEKLLVRDSSCEIYLHGATVTSWKVKNSEQLFLSSKALLDGSKAIRGGIPLVFPHFGTVEWSKLPQHGFARISKWRVLEKSETELSSSITLVLEPADVSSKHFDLWPHPFKLLYKVTLGVSTLKVELQVENVGSADFNFTALLHTYFRVQNVESVRVNGFKGCYFEDRDGEKRIQTEDFPQINREVDRVYQKVPNQLKITSSASEIWIEKTNLPDTVLWNPWIEKSKAMSDFEDGEYTQMVCVEAGHVSENFNLKPLQKWTCSQTLKSNL